MSNDERVLKFKPKAAEGNTCSTGKNRHWDGSCRWKEDAGDEQEDEEQGDY